MSGCATAGCSREPTAWYVVAVGHLSIERRGVCADCETLIDAGVLTISTRLPYKLIVTLAELESSGGP
jgi:hypothetical protein